MSASPLFAGFDFAAVAAWTPTVGALVVAYGYRGRVAEVSPDRGVLVRWMPGQGFGRGDGQYVRPENVHPAI